MKWIFKIFISIKRIFSMSICDHEKLIGEMEFILNIELDPFEEELIEELCGAGFHCKEISEFILYRRKRNSLRRLLKRGGFSTQDVSDIIKQYNEKIIGKGSAKEVFEKIKLDIEANKTKKIQKFNKSTCFFINQFKNLTNKIYLIGLIRGCCLLANNNPLPVGPQWNCRAYET